MSVAQRLLATIVLMAVIIAGAVVAGIVYQDISDASPVGRNEIAANGVVQGRLYPGDPEPEAALVAAEEERIEFVRTVSGSVPWRIEGVDGPYRVPTSPAPTLILTARSEPYTVADLQALAPETFVAQPDGSFRLSENLVALPGTTLDLTAGEPLRVALLSSADAFVSIVTIGAALKAVGTADAPAEFASFDPATGASDTNTADGRAYVRIMGGTVDLEHAGFSDLGFWSGDTGGLSLTGVREQAPPTGPEDLTTPTAEEGAPTLSSEDVQALVAAEEPDPGYVTGSLSDVSTTGNAFGIFVSRATALTIADSRVGGSLIDGIVLHRAVTDSEIRSTEVTGNFVDGISVARSSGSIILSGVTSSGNGRNGISIDGRPLADGPSANGTPTGASGDVAVSDSVIDGNARYGVEVSGGHGMSVSGSTITGNQVGIMLHHAAVDVEIAGNTMRGQDRQAIAVRGGVSDSAIHDNRISTVDTGVHIDGGSAAVEGNTFSDIARHAVTLQGDARGTRVVENVIGGHGTTPIHDDAAGGYVADNDTENWKQPVTARSVLNTIAQPLTLIWIALGLLVIFTALRGHRTGGPRSPYADRVPLTELSRGIVTPDKVRSGH